MTRRWGQSSDGLRSPSARGGKYGRQQEFRCAYPGADRQPCTANEKGQAREFPRRGQASRDRDSGEGARPVHGWKMQALMRRLDYPGQRTRKFPPGRIAPPVSISAWSRPLPSAEESFHIAIRDEPRPSGAFDLGGKPCLLPYIGRKHLCRNRCLVLPGAPGNFRDFAADAGVKLDRQGGLTPWFTGGERFPDAAHG